MVSRSNRTFDFAFYGLFELIGLHVGPVWYHGPNALLIFFSFELLFFGCFWIVLMC